MNLHILQHVSFEGAGSIVDWADENAHSITYTELFRNAEFPNQNDFDFLVIMGGPMNIYEESEYPWLIDEKRFISQTITSGKPVLGICLGSQLIADVLGAKVFRNDEVEIGWFPVEKTSDAKNHVLVSDLDFETPVFHWHGDTFSLPDGAVNLFRSQGCANQMFAFGSKVVGIQFHPEATPDAVKQMVTHGKDELVASRFIQSESEILDNHNSAPNLFLSKLLDRLSKN